MHIFYAAPDYALDRKTVATKLWRANLYDSLKDLGHKLVEFEIDYEPFNLNLDSSCKIQKEFIAINRPIFSEKLLNQVRRAHARQPIDLFFSYFYSAYVEPDAIREIGRLGIPTVNWYCNASYQFNLIEEIAPAYDVCLVPERDRLEDYRRVGANPLYCQEAANPRIYKPFNRPHDFDVTFVGQKYGTRPMHLAKLHQSGVEVHAWGPFWNQPPQRGTVLKRLRNRLKNKIRNRQPSPDLPLAQCGPPLSDQQLIEMYSRSRISLGFTAVDQKPQGSAARIQQVRLRDFEATMSGAFYLVEAFDELADFFEPDREIVFWHDTEELVDKVKYYLAHPKKREEIRQAGLRRARTEHTWKQRFETVFETMGLPGTAIKVAG